MRDARAGLKSERKGEEFESEAGKREEESKQDFPFQETGREREERGLWSQSQARRGLARMMKVTGIEQGHEMGVDNWCRIDCRTRKGNGDKASCCHDKTIDKPDCLLSRVKKKNNDLSPFPFLWQPIPLRVASNSAYAAPLVLADDKLQAAKKVASISHVAHTHLAAPVCVYS